MFQTFAGGLLQKKESSPIDLLEIFYDIVLGLHEAEDYFDQWKSLQNNVREKLKVVYSVTDKDLDKVCAQDFKQLGSYGWYFNDPYWLEDYYEENPDAKAEYDEKGKWINPHLADINRQLRKLSH